MHTKKTVMATNSIRFFTFDHVQKKIIGSQFNFDKSGIMGTEQYAALMIAMEKHPNYELSPIAPAKEKQTYQGLTLKFIKVYIDAFGTDDTKAQYDTYIKQKGHFATIKSWFLEEYKGFTTEKAMQELRKHAKDESHKKLVAVKAKVRESIKEKSIPSAPPLSLHESPAANY